MTLTGTTPDNEENLDLKGSTRDKDKQVMPLELRGLEFADYQITAKPDSVLLHTYRNFRDI